MTAVVSYIAQAELDAELRRGAQIRSRPAWLRAKSEALTTEHGAKLERLVAADRFSHSEILSFLANPDYARTRRDMVTVITASSEGGP